MCSTTALDLISVFVINYVAANREDYFIVGLTNTPPNVSAPVLGQYTVCGQYPGPVPAGATVYQACARNLLQYRYVIIQKNSSLTGQTILNFCEVEVYECGKYKFFYGKPLTTMRVKVYVREPFTLWRHDRKNNDDHCEVVGHLRIYFRIFFLQLSC